MERNKENFSYFDGLKMNLIISKIALFAISFNVYASDVTLNGNSSITIGINNHAKTLTFDTIINGYTVKCSGDKIILWGKPKKINEGNPQDTNVILVDLDQRHKNFEKSVSEGIFGADFIKGKDLAYIGTNQGLLFNLANGDLKPAGPEFDPTDDNNFESCKKDSSWEFNKYP